MTKPPHLRSFGFLAAALALATGVTRPASAAATAETPATHGDGVGSSGSSAATLLPADPVREAYVAAALAHNLALRQRGLSVEEASAQIAEARSRFFPTLAFEARATERYGALLDLGGLVNPVYATLNRQFGTNFPTDVTVALPLKRETKLVATQPLFAPALLDNYALRQEQTALERQQMRVAARQVRAEVQSAYFQFGRAQSLIALLDETRALLDENLRVSTLLVGQGKVTEDAVLRAKAELAEWEVTRAQAADGADNARRYLNFLAQKPADAPVPGTAFTVPGTDGAAAKEDGHEAANGGGGLPPLDEATTLARAQDRPELAALRSGQRVAGRAKRLAQDAYWPTLGAAAEYGFQGDRYDFSLDKDYLLVSLVLRFNLWNGFGDEARVRAAESARQRLAVAEEELQQQIGLEVHRALRAVATAGAAIAKVSARVESTRASYDIVARRYAAGAAAPLELLDARTARTRAAIDQIVARYDLALKLVELERVAALAPETQP